MKVNWERLDRIAGFRLDRRGSYRVIDGEVCRLSVWTGECTGCLEREDGHPVGEYPYDAIAMCLVGNGCRECGYTGKRLWKYWLPVEHIAAANGAG